jgi:hypothetical protein
MKNKLGNFVAATIMAGYLGFTCHVFSNIFFHGKSFSTVAIEDIKLVESVEFSQEERDQYSKIIPSKKQKHTTLSWQEAITEINDPLEVQDYLFWHLNYKDEHVSTTFSKMHEDREADCMGYSLSAAALLSDNNYPPYILATVSTEGMAHAVFLYKTKEGFGALGNSPLSPQYETIDDLLKTLYTIYPFGGEVERYAIIDLDKTFPNKEWIEGDIITELRRVDKIYKPKIKD